MNPARSTGPALFVGGWALQQLWLFWVAPILGGVIGGLLHRWLSTEEAVDALDRAAAAAEGGDRQAGSPGADAGPPATLSRRGRGREPPPPYRYSATISPWKRSSTARRFTFMVGVSSPFST